MKKMTWFLYIAIIAVTGILIGFTGYTTDPVKTTTTEVVTATVRTEAASKKPCGCCAKRSKLQQARIKLARERKLAREQAGNTSAPRPAST